MTPRNSCLAVAEVLSGLLKQSTKFFFRQDTMFSSNTLQRYMCMQIQLYMCRDSYLCEEIAKCVQR